MKHYIFVTIAALALAGCAQAIDDANYLHFIARAYVEENTEARQEARRECREIRRRQAEALIAERKWAEAMALWAGSYPPLVTADIVKTIEENGVSDLLDKAHACAPVASS